MLSSQMLEEIKEILNTIITSLEEINEENSNVILQQVYKEYYTKVHQDDKDGFFTDMIFDVTSSGNVDISDFKMNDLTLLLYEKNKEKIHQLEFTALKLYKLIDKDDSTKIPFMENLKSEKAQEMELLQEKQFITVQEFTTIFGYSATQQKGFRSRLRDPIPYSQKDHGHKVLYERRKVQKWLES